MNFLIKIHIGLLLYGLLIKAARIFGEYPELPECSRARLVSGLLSEIICGALNVITGSDLDFASQRSRAWKKSLRMNPR